MKKTVGYLIAGIVLAAGFGANIRAQNKAPMQRAACMDTSMRRQADDIRQHYVSQGFIVLRETVINMESMVPTAVSLQLARGQLYQIVFVGQPDATNHKMIIYDSNESKIDEKFVFRSHSDAPSNYLIYEMVPERSDTYLLSFMTRLKNRKFCGSLCILTPDRSKDKIKYTPYVP